MQKRAFPPLPTRPRLVLAVYPALFEKDSNHSMKSCRCSHHGPRIYFLTSPIIFTAKKLKQASPGGGKITTKQLRHLCVCVHSVFVCLFWFCVFVLCVFVLCVFALCVFVLCVFALCVFALHDYPTMQYYVLYVAFTAAKSVVRFTIGSGRTCSVKKKSTMQILLN